MLANNHFVEDGRFFSDADLTHAARVCVIGTDVADALFPHRDPIDEELTLGARAYRVIGCSRRRGPSSAAATTTSWRSRSPPSTSSSRDQERRRRHDPHRDGAEAPEDVPALIEEETAILRARRGLRPDQPDDFAMFTSEGILQNFQQITAGSRRRCW